MSIASHAIMTDTQWSMHLHMALGVGGTDVRLQARVLAGLVDTGFVVGAF